MRILLYALIAAIPCLLSDAPSSRADGDPFEAARLALPRYRLPPTREERALTGVKAADALNAEAERMLAAPRSGENTKTVLAYFLDLASQVFEDVARLDLGSHVPNETEAKALAADARKLKEICSSPGELPALRRDIDLHRRAIDQAIEKQGEALSRDPERSSEFGILVHDFNSAVAIPRDRLFKCEHPG